MFDNQYIITNTTLNAPSPDMACAEFSGVFVYTHARLKCTIANGSLANVLILGIAVNPFNPNETESDIAHRIADTCQNKVAFFEAASELTGRYVVVYASDDAMVMVGDPCHLRQMFYGQLDQNIVVTSSIKLFLTSFGLTQQTSVEKQEFMNSSLYKSKYGLWYGDQTPDDRLSRLLANHYLDMRTTLPQRLPVAYIMPANNEAEIIEYSKNILEGTFDALSKQYKLMLAITAGIDSRALLAASRKYTDKINYYILHDVGTDPSDISVSTAITEKLGVTFSVIPVSPLRQDFIERFSNEYVDPIVQPGLVHTQYYYDQKYGTDTINVNGIATEIIRCFYGATKSTPTVDMLLQFSKYGDRIPYVRKEIEKWYEGAKEYAAAMNISLLDLFYWEQRIGIWGAMYRTEQDVAFEEIAPFNNRKLLLAITRVKIAERNFPNFKFFLRLIENMWKETLSEPINPNVPYYKKLVKVDAKLYATGLKTMIAMRTLQAVIKSKFTPKVYPAGHRNESLLSQINRVGVLSVSRSLVRSSIMRMRWLYLTKVWKMDIHPYTLISLKAKLDFSNPRGVHIGEGSNVSFGAVILAHDIVNRSHGCHTRIGKCCAIGANSFIMPGITIGDHSVVGACSVVTKDVPAHSMVVGNPARVIKTNIETGDWGILIRPSKNAAE